MHRGTLPDSAKIFSILECKQQRLIEGITLDSALGNETEATTLAWLVAALEHARSEDQTKVVGYLEEVADDVVFEVEMVARRTSLVG
jgi:hypothetical protein